jgi:hypothetical protein
VGINASADAINCLSIAAPETLLTHKGVGYQVKVNNASVSDTASLLFQTGFSGRAEMGIAGQDHFALKVSANGTDWSWRAPWVRCKPRTGWQSQARLQYIWAICWALWLRVEGCRRGLRSNVAAQRRVNLSALPAARRCVGMC